MSESEQTVRKGREGGRWWNERPAAEEVAAWFKTVPLHDGMKHDDFVHGIVLIEGKPERNSPERFYTAYPRVDVRVAYFHSLMLQNPDWLGVIEPVGGGEGDLPPGFSVRTIQHMNRNGDKAAVTRFVCCTMQVKVFDRKTIKEQVREPRRGEVSVVRTGLTVIDAPPATKMVPLLQYPDKPDPFSMMKAETGAVGRALGMAGMLVVPGAGVATAEDMHEAQTLEGSAAASEQVQEKAAPPPTTAAEQESQEGALREQITVALNTLGETDPKALERFQAWSQEKGNGRLADCNLLQLKGILKKAEKDLDAALTAAAAEPATEEGEG